jgi:hypothetical protein
MESYNTQNPGASPGSEKVRPPSAYIDEQAVGRIPAELRREERWVVWGWVWKEAKWDKPPLNPNTSTATDATDPSAWTTFEKARETAPLIGDGIGYALGTDGPYTGVDLDKVIDDEGVVAPWAQEIVDRLDSYTERTPSRHGLRIWVKGRLPRNAKGKARCKTSKRPGIEFYDSDRYFTVTGDHWPGTPLTIEDRSAALAELHGEIFGPKPKPGPGPEPDHSSELPDDDDLIRMARDARNGLKFRALFDAGDVDRYHGDESAADFALVGMLAFWTGPDPDRIERIFGRSALGRRDKWRDRADYRELTIGKVLDGKREFYTPHRNGRGPRPSADGDGDGEQPAEGTPDPRRVLPEILISTREHEVIDQAIAALKDDPDIYQRGNALVHVVRDTAPAKAILRPAGQPRILTVPPPVVRKHLTKNAQWVRVKEDRSGNLTVVPGHPPDWAVSAVHAHKMWDGVRHIEAVVEAPVLRSDGTILDTPGYDLATGILYEPNAEYPPIPGLPTRLDAQRAASLLLELVSDFPFAIPEGTDSIRTPHRAAWVAALLTPLARFAIAGPSPLFLFDANAPGVGKSLLADLIATIVANRSMPRTAYPDNDEEMRKRITSIALAGDSLMLIDNIASTFGGSSLDSALTGTTWQDRILGRSEMTPELPLITTWYATGNNVALRGDAVRRVLPCRLETNEEKPEERTGFTIEEPLLRYVGRRRPELVAAALTILRAYFAAGRPRQQDLKPLGSFEAWSRRRAFGGLLDARHRPVRDPQGADRFRPGDAGTQGAGRRVGRTPRLRRGGYDRRSHQTAQGEPGELRDAPIRAPRLVPVERPAQPSQHRHEAQRDPGPDRRGQGDPCRPRGEGHSCMENRAAPGWD